ncbi:MAG: PIG-L family deacetylase, partial [Clostridia bacterium]|nr:PIG-L family deacetylase [Clostridia bacterium]
MSKTIVAVGAHTGDAQLTAGLLLAKHAMAGDRIVTIDLTAGERGCPPGRTPEDFRPENVAAAQAFAQGLGGESHVLDTPDGELEHTQGAALALAGLLRRVKADAVLCHWKHSMHKDHLAAHQITADAVFFAALATFPHELPPAPIRRVLFAENWEDAERFAPYLYVDV